MRDSGGLSAWTEAAAFDKNRQVVGHDPDYGDDRVSVFGLWRKGCTHESGDVVLTCKNKKREILCMQQPS